VRPRLCPLACTPAVFASEIRLHEQVRVCATMRRCSCTPALIQAWIYRCAVSRECVRGRVSCHTHKCASCCMAVCLYDPVHVCTCARRFQGRCMSNYMVRLLAGWLLYKRREKVLRQTYIKFAKHDHRSSLSCAFQR
jgi:hypothetical protein